MNNAKPLHSENIADFHRNLCNGVWGSFEIWLLRKETLIATCVEISGRVHCQQVNKALWQANTPPHCFCNTKKNQIRCGLRIKCLWHITCTLQASPGYLPRDICILHSARWYYLLWVNHVVQWISSSSFLSKIRSFSMCTSFQCRNVTLLMKLMKKAFSPWSIIGCTEKGNL